MTRCQAFLAPTLSLLLAVAALAQSTTEPKGLQIELSEPTGRAGAGAAAPEPAAAAALSAEQAENVLARLEPLETREGDVREFALPAATLPPPIPGDTIERVFPPESDQGPPAVQPGAALEVLRYAPEGDLPIAGQLSVTFSQPMVPLTSHGALSAMKAPVTMTPQPAGEWQWVGTRTLIFAPEVRMPMATRYSVSVDPTATSQLGGKLAAPVSWEFATPPPTVAQAHPKGGPVGLTPVCFLSFDQRIDPAAVLEHVVMTQGRERIAVRGATKEEISADAGVASLAKAAAESRWLAFVPTSPLRTEMQVHVALHAGVPSAEGPRTSREARVFGFETYGELEVVERRCGWRDSCAPDTPWRIRMSNPLDAGKIDASMITIKPVVPFKLQVSGAWLQVQPRSKPDTRYDVTLSGQLPDAFGQTLIDAETVVFRVGDAAPQFFNPGGNFAVLDPRGEARFPVYTVNYKALSVRGWRVAAEDYRGFLDALRTAYRGRNPKPFSPPGELVIDRKVKIQGPDNELVETLIDLGVALTDDLGHVILEVEPEKLFLQDHPGGRILTWVQRTRIGLDAVVDATDLLAWVTALDDGSPIAAADVSVLPAAGGGKTDARGLARIPLQAAVASPSVLVARTDGDSAILPSTTSAWGGRAWQRRDTVDSLAWYVTDDRFLYKPGEQVRFKGWLRKLGGGKDGRLEAAPGGIEVVEWKAMDPRGNEVASGRVPVGRLGGFDGKFQIPAESNLGNGTIRFSAVGSSLARANHNHRFKVQEFRRPEFEVGCTASQGPQIIQESAQVTVNASYFAGGGLPDAPVQWAVTTTAATYVPPGRDRFSFGAWTPWWIHRGGAHQRGKRQVQSFPGVTDFTGSHTLQLEFVSVDPPRPMHVKAEAAVTDVNRQRWAASASMVVHPGSHYVGIRSDRSFVREGEPIEIEAIACGIDGDLLAGREIQIRVARLDWVQEKGEWKQVEADLQEQTLKSGTESVRARFPTSEGGTYRVTATVRDEKQRPNQSLLNVWVAGGKVPPTRKVEIEALQLIPAAKSHEPGQTAEILVVAPFHPCQGLLTLRRDGVVETRAFTMNSPSHTLLVPVTSEHVPNLHVSVELVGAAPRLGPDGIVDPALPKRPAIARGALALSVPPLERTLGVTVAPASEEVEPGASTTVEVTVAGPDGLPVEGAEVLLIVVDEAILALSGGKFADPLETFYRHRGDGASDYHLRPSVLLADPDTLVAMNDAPEESEAGGEDDFAGGRSNEDRREMKRKDGAPARRSRGAAPPPPGAPPTAGLLGGSWGAGGGGGGAPDPIRVRSDFAALAAFEPELPTDSAGKATVSVQLPDNLTRYRIQAIAVAGARRFGTADSAVTARLPLLLRPSAPRFLNFGDRLELPIIVANQTKENFEVDVALRCTTLTLTAGNGRRVRVPAGDRVEIRFPATADHAGIARFQVAAVAGGIGDGGEWSDAAEFELPVWTPATTEAFATYGEVDEGSLRQPMQVPDGIVREFGGVEITTSSTAMAALTDAVLYLHAYPFDCAEQISSRVLAVAALRDVLAAFDAEGLPPPQEIEAAVDRDIERLVQLQNPDGSFGFWRRGAKPWPYLGVHVAHAFARAIDAGFAVPAETLARSKDYLWKIDQHIPDTYGIDARRSLTAYALYVRARLGDSEADAARRLVRQAGADGLTVEAMGWLLSVLAGERGSDAEAATLRRALANRATETASTAHFATSYGDGDHLLLHSNRRSDAVALEALIQDQPDSDLIPKLARGLLAHRQRGRWGNTQENAFVLLALSSYFHKYEKAEPAFTARAWIGQSHVADEAFSGREVDRRHLLVPFDFVARGQGDQDLVLQKVGAGRLYWRLGMRYALEDLKVDALDRGFVVERTYLPVNDDKDVQRDEDGTWRVRAGATVAVRVTMVADSRRYHVALQDPISAGLEALNPALATTGDMPDTTPLDPGPRRSRRGWWWWARPWYEHQNLRDHRAEAFSSLLWDGVYTYTYYARATTPGTFVVPPAKAEEMYHPETFGRSSSDRMVVE